MTADAIARINGWVIESATCVMSLPPSTSGLAFAPVPVRQGERVRSVAVLCASLGGAANDITASLRRVASVAGSSPPGMDTALVAATSLVPGNGLQRITLMPSSPDLVTPDVHYHVRIQGAASTGTKYVVRLEVSTDPQ